jgi:hypothetical protein
MYDMMDKAGLSDSKSRVGLRIYRLYDTLHAPSWAVSHLAQHAVDTKVDYLYQINDDVVCLAQLISHIR